MRRIGIALLLGVGVLLVAFSLFAPRLSSWIVLATVDDLNRGVPLSQYESALRTLLAPRATVRAVPVWAGALAGGVGAFCCYLAAFLWLNPTRSLRELFTLAYWREYSASWTYTPFAEQLARAKAARKKTTPP